MNGSLWALMMTRMTPSLALILPFFIVFRTFGLIDTRTALVIAYCSLILPLSTWMMKGYFENLPPNLEKAALVDGCTPFQAIWKIILPVARPGIVAAGIFCFLVSWNEFVFALILTGSPKAQTIPVIIAGFLVQLRFYDYGPMFAASVLAVIPPVVIALGSSAIWCAACCPARSRARGDQAWQCHAEQADQALRRRDRRRRCSTSRSPTASSSRCWAPPAAARARHSPASPGSSG